MPSTDKAKGKIPVDLGGSVRWLKFDFWAWSLLDEEKGDSEQFVVGVYRRMTRGKLVPLVWAGLVHELPELDGASPEARRAGQKVVAQWLNDADLQQVANAVFRALNASFPAMATKGKDAGEETPEKNGESAEKADSATGGSTS